MENGEPPKVYIRKHGTTSISGLDDERLAIRNSTFRFVIETVPYLNLGSPC